MMQTIHFDVCFVNPETSERQRMLIHVPIGQVPHLIRELAAGMMFRPDLVSVAVDGAFHEKTEALVERK
jgi:hypothetical protein